MSRKKSQTQDLLEAIMIRYGLNSVKEAWAIYHKQYENKDIELDPKLVAKLQNASVHR